MNALREPQAIADAVHRGRLVALPTPSGWMVVGRAGERVRLAALVADADANLALTGGDRERLKDFLPTTGLRAQRLVERLLPGPLALRFGANGPLVRLPQAAEWSALTGSRDPLLCVVVQNEGDRLWPVAEMERRWPLLAIAGAPADGAPRHTEARLLCERGAVTVERLGTLAPARVRDAGKLRLLCICTGNTCRSPMLGALLRAELARRGLTDIAVESAGLAAGAGQPASPEAVVTIAARGLDLSAHRSRATAGLDLAAYDRIYCMTSNHAAALSEAGVPPERLAVVNGERGGVPDPYGGSQADYDACARSLELAARDIAGEI